MNTITIMVKKTSLVEFLKAPLGSFYEKMLKKKIQGMGEVQELSEI